MSAESPNVRMQRTQLAVIGTSILNEPLWTLYILFAFILHKDLHSTAFQIAVLTMLKPVISIFSLYWSSSILKKPEKLLNNVLWAGILSRIPFLFFPMISSPWILIASIVFYTMLYRGGMPGWIEILKQNIPGAKRGMIFSLGSAAGYVEGVVLAIGVGYLLDHFHESWRWMFPLSALIGIGGVFLQSRIPMEIKKVQLPFECEGIERPKSAGEYLLKPWKNAWDLLRTRKDFSCYQWGVMLCGIGIMVIQPALPLFFVDVLGLSYIDLAIALSICKGLGFAATSPMWGKWLHRVSIYNISSLVFVMMGAFPLLLLFSSFHVSWVYAAYMIYGVAQAGSHLTWHLSGASFAEDEDSSLYSTVNVMMVGLRGAVVPPMGSLFCLVFGPLSVLGIGVFFCLYGGVKIFSYGRQFKPQELETIQ